MKILIFGDSFSANINEGNVYADFLSFNHGHEVENFARVGVSNDFIHRYVIENCLDRDSKDTFVLIGWSYLHRQEVNDYDHIVEDSFKFSGNLVTLDWILKSEKAKSHHKELAMYDWNFVKLLTDFYTNAYILSQWLELKGFKYKFFNADPGEIHTYFIQQMSFLKVYQAVCANKNIINFDDFSIPTWAKENNLETKPTGHLNSEKEHEIFADFINKNFLY